MAFVFLFIFFFRSFKSIFSVSLSISNFGFKPAWMIGQSEVDQHKAGTSTSSFFKSDLSIGIN